MLIHWDSFVAFTEDSSVPEIESTEFAKAPVDVRALCHKLSARAARDVFHAYVIMVKPEVSSDSPGQILRGFVSSGCASGAPWANEEQVRLIHREYLKSIDWNTSPDGQDRPPF